MPQSQVYAGRGKAVAKGTRKFGEAVWKPFAHASSVLWLEVTGLFFGIFTLFFGMNTYKLRHEWSIGPDHQRFLVYIVVTAGLRLLYFQLVLSCAEEEKLKRRAGR